MRKICSVKGCERFRVGRGYCNMHYSRLMRHGDPLAGGPFLSPRGEPERFIHEVAMQHTGDECLTWPFGGNGAGYGKGNFNGKYQYAHRYVCTLAHGEPPASNYLALHRCGKGHEGCVNPKHLYWGTASDNIRDTIAHGTANRGERTYCAKLSEADVKQIKARLECDTMAAIASDYGVHRSTIRSIKIGQSWKHVPTEPEWDETMLAQVRPDAFPAIRPAAPEPSDPEMRPVNIDRLIEATRARSLLKEASSDA